MHQIGIQKLSKLIPVPFRQWKNEHVVQWLTLNQIQFDPQPFNTHQINGQYLLQINPEELIKKFGLTIFIAKQIVQWVQEQAQEFDHLVRRQFQGCVVSQSDSDDCFDSIQSQQQTKQQNNGLQIINLQENQQKKQERMFEHHNAKNQINDQTQRICERQKLKIFEKQLINDLNDNKNGVKVGKWEKKKTELIENKEGVNQQDKKVIINKNKLQNSPIKQENPHIKFITSEYIEVKKQQFLQKKVRVTYQGSIKIVDDNCSIGRNTSKYIVLTEDSVSRNHAQIKKIVKNEQVKYYLKDCKSKFGTYVKFNFPLSLVGGQGFMMEQYEITIVRIQVSKYSSINRQKCFDITLKIDNEEKKLLNKHNIVIGSKKNADWQLETASSAKIWLDKEKSIVFIQCTQGDLYRKIQPFDQYDLENLTQSQNKVLVSFGLQKCDFSIVFFCQSCRKQEGECSC